MAREYLKSLHAQRKFSNVSLQSNTQKLKTHRQFRTNNVFGQQPKHSASFKKPLSNNLPIRSRPNFEMVAKTRSRTSGPKSVSSSASQKKTPSQQTAPPIGREKSTIIGEGSQKRASELTENDEDRYAKRLRLELVTDINSDALTNKSKDNSQRKIDNYYLTYLTSYQREGRADLRFDWKRMPVRSQQGMKNLTGVLCYRLSSLQALFHLPVFVNWVMDSLKPVDCLSDAKADCVSCCLHKLVTEYWAGINVLKTLNRLDAILKSKGWVGDVGSGQEDPEEQVTVLFNLINEEIPAKKRTTLESMTAFKYTTTMVCPDCGYNIKSHNQPMGNLSLPMEVGAATVMENVERFTKGTRDDWKCNSCTNRVDAPLNLEFSHFPDLLTVQLKRYEYKVKLDRSIKNKSNIPIPKILDLTKFQSKEKTYPGPGPSGKVEYELTSVVSHSGNMIGGHYICHAAGPDGQWLKFNDSIVTKSSAAECSKNFGSFTPYILYYRKKA
ncbi:hypothetical protein BKA65DRAFT_545313 [Rhexocercosporidium sp. MPI-PUGE-AT-0058]|nr:hypothetical protein BKA65DRAFT_545313 [Rhexocercosporidium sp. MPI-PUGE-AT-0058]